MEYAQMINEPSLISGLSTLLKDQDLTVVKRTIRVFANVYRHSLEFLAKGKLDEQTFTKAWPIVHGIGNQLVEMLKNSENEGLTIHIVRFLEASVVAKLLSDISRYPSIASKMGETINMGIKSLKDLLLLPYVGGSSFIVGMRAIITIACYKSSIRKEVVDLIENLIAKPPPTLFDHHVRSLHKVLQRNLFRLLRREEGPEERERLIDMMVKVGVPRRMLSQWAPQSAGRKRSAGSDSNSDEDSDGSTQSQKKMKYKNKDYRCPPLPGLPPAPLPSLPPGSPPALPPGSPPRLPPDSPPALPPALPPGSPPGSPPMPPPGSPPPTTSVPNVPNLSTHYDQLKNIFSGIRSQKTTKEEIIYDALENPDVVELVMTCIDEVSDAHVEEELMANLAKAGDESEMRKILSVLLVKILPTSITDSIQCVDQNRNNSMKLTDPRLSHVPEDRIEKVSSLTNRRSDSVNESVESNVRNQNISNSQDNDEREQKLTKDYSDFINSIETREFLSDETRATEDTIPTSSNSQLSNNFTHTIQDYDHRIISMPPFSNGNQNTDNPNMGNRQISGFNGPRGMFDNGFNYNIPSNMNPRMMPPQRMGQPMNGTPFGMGQMGFHGHPGGPMHMPNGMVQVPGRSRQPGPPGHFMGGYPPPMMPNTSPWLPPPDMSASLHLPMNSQPNMMNRTPMRM